MGDVVAHVAVFGLVALLALVGFLALEVVYRMIWGAHVFCPCCGEPAEKVGDSHFGPLIHCDRCMTPMEGT